MEIEQLIIFITGAISVALLACKNIKLARWGHVIGALGEPWWLKVTFKAGQWGMFWLAIWFTFSYLRGVINYFWRANAKAD